MYKKNTLKHFFCYTAVMKKLYFLLIMPLLLACSEELNTSTDSRSNAYIRAVDVSTSEGTYRLHVKVESYDTGCDNYADWWEVLDARHQLLYRRILVHSHVNEQPFTRSGLVANLQKDQRVFIRVHKNVDGYGKNIFVGSISERFSELKEDIVFDAGIERSLPQPSGCAF